MDRTSLPQIDHSDVRRYIEFMRIEYERFHFGSTWFARVVKDFDLLFDCAGAPGEVLPPKYIQKCYFTYVTFEAWSALPPLEWIRDHRRIRSRLMQLVGSPRDVPTEVPPIHRRKTSYRMTHQEYSAWTADVFRFIKKYTWDNRDDLREPENLEDAQICIDAIHQLVESNKPTPRRQLDFLIKICQTFMLLPSRLEKITSESLDQHPQGGNNNSIGISSVVRKAITTSGETVAIKEIRLFQKTWIKNKRQFIKESLILHHLSHPNILAFRGVIFECYRLCIMSHWLEHGDINQYIRNHPQASIKELLEGIADGLDFTHSYGIVHGDLKGANILVDADGKPRISDFGLSFVYDPRAAARDTASAPKPLEFEGLIRAFTSAGLPESQSSSLASTVLSSNQSQAGTIHWMSPERLHPDQYKQARAKATPESDVFSFAMVAVEAYTGQIPFGNGVREGQYAVKIVVQKTRPNRPDNMPVAIWRIVVDCWRDLPQERPSIKDVYFRISNLSR